MSLTPDLLLSSLEAFSEGRLDVHDVFRRILSLASWWVPAGTSGPWGTLGQPEPAHGIGAAQILGEAELPPGELWLFSDLAAVVRARQAGQKLGALRQGVPADAVWSAVNSDWTTIRINPLSPARWTWEFPRESFEFIAVWRKILHLEQGLAQLGDPPPSLREAVAEFRHFMVLRLPNATLLTMPGRAGLKNPAIVLTAPDCLRATQQALPQPLPGQVQPIQTTGMELFTQLPEQGVDGLIVNPHGPGATAYLQFDTATTST